MQSEQPGTSVLAPDTPNILYMPSSISCFSSIFVGGTTQSLALIFLYFCNKVPAALKWPILVMQEPIKTS